MIKKIKSFIKKYFSGFAYYYSYLKYRVFIVVIISLLTGVMDGFGIALFLPLLQVINNPGSVNTTSMGKMAFILNGIKDAGIPLNLVSVLVLMVVFFVFKGVFKFLGTYYKVIVQNFFMRNLRFQTLVQLGKIKYESFVSADGGRIQNVVTTETGRLAQGFSYYVLTVQQLILVLVYVGFAFTLNSQFAFFVTIATVLSNFIFRLVYKHTKEFSYRLTLQNNSFQGFIMQLVGNFKYLKATDKISKILNIIFGNILRIEKVNKKIGLLNGILVGIREPLMIIIISSVLLLEVNVMGGSMGPIILSLLFFYRALTALMALQGNWNSYLSVSGSIRNLREMQQFFNENKEHNGREPYEEFKNGIALEKVSFSYDDAEVLRDIDFKIEKNKTVAIVGESGSGKSTLVSLIAGLLDVNRGDVFLDNTSIKSLNRPEFRRRIGYVTQDPVIFYDTVFNNVTFWDEDTPENKKRFWDVVRKTSALKFVSEMPDKENTLLGINGINLSGGQKQRISIARELYKNVDVLILDEATSALDTENENIIQQSVKILKGKFTILIVAHRLSTVKHADCIFVLKDGRIADSGNYTELMEKSEIFKTMVQLQKL